MIHSNNFTILRLIAASTVIFHHAYDLQRLPDYSQRLTGVSFGTLAVGAFFAISGYLVYQSITRNPNIARFAAARALRILPGLWVMLLVVWLSASLISSLPARQYFADYPAWLTFLTMNATVMKTFQFLPGVFADNPSAAYVNASIWTLRFEFICYAGLAIVSAAGLLASERLRRVVIVIAFVASTGWFFFERYAIEEYTGILWWLHFINAFGFCFLLGMAYAEFKIAPKFWHVALTLALAFALSGTFLFWPAACLGIAAALFVVAFSQSPALVALRGIPDVSYGVYIYAYPIQQAIVFGFGLMHPMLHAALALALTVIPAALSWFLIEQPALRWKASPRRRDLRASAKINVSRDGDLKHSAARRRIDESE